MLRTIQEGDAASIGFAWEFIKQQRRVDMMPLSWLALKAVFKRTDPGAEEAQAKVLALTGLSPPRILSEAFQTGDDYLAHIAALVHPPLISRAMLRMLSIAQLPSAVQSAFHAGQLPNATDEEFANAMLAPFMDQPGNIEGARRPFEQPDAQRDPRIIDILTRFPGRAGKMVWHLRGNAALVEHAISLCREPLPEGASSAIVASGGELTRKIISTRPELINEELLDGLHIYNKPELLDAALTASPRAAQALLATGRISLPPPSSPDTSGACADVLARHGIVVDAEGNLTPGQVPNALTPS